MKHLPNSINAKNRSITLRAKKGLRSQQREFSLLKHWDHINNMQRLRKLKHRGRKRGNRAANSDKYQALKRLQSVDTITRADQNIGQYTFFFPLIVLFFKFTYFRCFFMSCYTAPFQFHIF